jgi:multiple sugar transport system substrate-binding protein
MTDTKGAFGQTLSRRRLLGMGALAGIGVASSGLAACGGGSSGGPGGGAGGGGGGGGGQQGGAVTWASWANPGEAERFKQYSQDYQKRTGTKTTYQTVVGDYTAKLLTQLQGGSAADAFYVGDTGMAKLQESNNLVELTEFLGTPDGQKASGTFPGLVDWTKSKDGGIYGVCVDCNPMVFWFNKGLLDQAGVTTDPAAAFEGGTWTRDALDDLLTKVKATGKRGYVHMASYGDLFGLVTALGGTMIEDNKAVFDEDPKAQEIIGWLFDSIANGNISYGGSLPKGQSSDALFLAGQLATTHQGRWILPNLKKIKNIQYDIAPYPSEDGKTIGPIIVFTAAMSVNAKAKDQEVAKKFLADFVSVDGQRFRLSGGGNAVPSVAGLDEVVTEGDLPAHGKWFIDIAKAGYAIPTLLARNATLAVNWETDADKLMKTPGMDATTFSQTMAKKLNEGAA